MFGMRRQGSPDVRHAINLLGGFDVLEDRSNLGVIGVFVDQFHCAHVLHDPHAFGLMVSKPRDCNPWAWDFGFFTKVRNTCSNCSASSKWCCKTLLTSQRSSGF